MIAVDIERSSARPDLEKARLRGELYRLVHVALRACGIGPSDHDPLVDRGDGVLILVRPSDRVPKTTLLSRFVPALVRLLADHNLRGPAFRLRVAIHAGEVLYDAWAPFGESVDICCRLLDAPELKFVLHDTTAPLVLVVSEDIYNSTLRHGYDGIDCRVFHPLVRVTVGEREHRGWVATGRAAPICVE
ncbi:hypothetical protein BU204_13140 [Actinophytocola xanthii]|uniref:Guanylate cyclase domain-containing protein n=2 Tax=Actinophytocola xanthii TaxID=1912961 RepID=A0A1Q8CRX5_9PSEU|nr:hypothetical protein BU204_13140 [Actinophytocola xanthii]